MTRDDRMINEHVAGCAAAHQLLLGSLDGLTDAESRDPSKLPNWSRGHVLTHLARNADSHAHLLVAAGGGEIADQYPGGVQARNQAIEDGATRSAAELINDVRTSIYSLEAQWARSTPTTWAGQGRTARGAVIAMSDLVFLRWREVEVHHADLDRGFGWQQWSDMYVRLELEAQTMLWRSRKPMGLTDLPAIALQLPPHHRLAWLLGRIEVEGLPKPDPI
ncbi:MAG: maleylpyruvate isomerase N-terminal domain-containing protein [Ilumatobacteraceae bacterium]